MVDSGILCKRFKKVANMVKDQQLEVEQISPQLFEQYLVTQDQPAVDFINSHEW